MCSENPTEKISFFTINIIIALILFGCGETPQKKTGALSIDTFREVPTNIKGCSCTFSNDDKELANGDYIFACDYGNTAYLNINGELTKFTKSLMEETDGTTVTVRYTNEHYDIEMNTVNGIENAQGKLVRGGNIHLTDKSGNGITRKFYGVCGC